MNNSEIYYAAGRGIEALQTRQKMISQEHRERIKRLRNVQYNVMQSERKGGPTLLTVEAKLSPDIEALISDPVAGL